MVSPETRNGDWLYQFEVRLIDSVLIWIHYLPAEPLLGSLAHLAFQIIFQLLPLGLANEPVVMHFQPKLFLEA